MVNFVDIAAGTDLFFTDNGSVSGAFKTGKSYPSWTSGASTIAAGTVPNTTALIITASPEPESAALLSAGMSGLAFVARRCP